MLGFEDNACRIESWVLHCNSRDHEANVELRVATSSTVYLLSVVEVHHLQTYPSQDHRIDPTWIHQGESSGKAHQELDCYMSEEEEKLYSVSKEVVS